MFLRIVFSALSMLAVAAAAELAASKVTVPAGSTTTQVEIRLRTTGEKLTALQGDIGLAPGFAATAVAGDAATTAGKQLTVVDVGDSRKRFVLAGINRNAIDDGVVITLNITIPRSAAHQSSVTITKAIGTEADGRTVSLSAKEGAVFIGNSQTREGDSRQSHR